MGSFNITCSISNQPIHWNEKVKVGFIAKSPMYDMIRSCSQYRFVFPFLLDGVYDDYGTCKVEAGEETRKMADEFLKKYAIFEVNDETFPNTDTPLNRENLNLNTIYHYLHEGVLYFNHGDAYAAREKVEFVDVYSKPIELDQPVQVYPFTIKKEVYDKIISGSFDPRYAVFEDGKLRYENLSFDDYKQRVFGSESVPTLRMFFTMVIDSMRLGGSELDPSVFVGSEQEKNNLFEELDNILTEMPRSTYMILNMATRDSGNNNAFKERVESIINTSSDDPEDKAESQGLEKLVNFFETNKNKLDLSSIHRKTVYDIADKKSSNDSGFKTTHYFHEYEEFFLDCKDFDIEEAKNFFVFMDWYDNYVHGTITPSRYAGQDFNSEAFRTFYQACISSIDSFERMMEDEYGDDDEEE